MKFHELAACLAPALPGGLARAERMRELISMFATVTEDEWGTSRDPSTLPSDSVLESMASRASGFTKKLANAICARLDIDAFVERLYGLDLATQELIAQNIAAHDEHVDLESFECDVAELLVGILHEKAGLPDRSAAVLRRAKIHAAFTKNRDLLLTRSRGCATCDTPLRTRSYDSSQASYDIVFLDDATEPFGPDDFAVLCKPCAERFKEQQLLRAQLRPLTEQLDQLTGKLAIVEDTLAGRTRITTDDLEELYTYFPHANREHLETVEYYHHALTGILGEQLTEQRRLYTTQVEALKREFRAQQAKIVSLGESVQLDDETYQRSLELHTKITQLDEQIRTFDHNQKLKEERKALKKEIEESIPATLGELTTQINAEMRDVMDALYPSEPRKAPIFTFKAVAKGVSYTFDHNGDTGSGAKFNHLVALDIAVLRSTPLPFLIHDSAIIKLIAFAPVAELLAVYTNTANLTSRAGEAKQVFFSFDATKAYGTKAEERVAPAQVIRLSEGAEALYGFTWNTETTVHHDPQPSEGGQR